MGHLFTTLLLATALAGSTSAALGQKATEIHVPIGQSPGLSGKHTLLGRVQSVEVGQRTMTVVDGAGSTVTVRADAKTALWLDRSKLKLPNRKGDFSDFRKDMTVEVKYRNNDAQAAAVEWIKLQATE